MNLPKAFATYLKLQGASPVTVRNYSSDLRHFLGWLELTLRSHNLPLLDNEAEFLRLYFTAEIIAEYKKFLSANRLPISTVNRRLSTLRSLGKFCLSQSYLIENPAIEINNLPIEVTFDSKEKIEAILEEFGQALKKEKSSTNTIKNYLSDIRTFFAFVEATG